MASRDFLTVLSCAANGLQTGVACKTLCGDGEAASGIRLGSFFRTQLVPIDGLHHLFSVLEGLVKRPDLFVLRDALRFDRDPTISHRRTKENYVEVPHHWVMLDVDDIEAPEDLDPASLEAVDWLISQRLPREFQSASYIGHFSSSAGTRKAGRKVKAHLFFWSTVPVTSTSLRLWAAGRPVDGAVFNPIQPHFTADPRWVDGAVDPLEGKRLFLVEKEQHDLDLKLDAIAPMGTRGAPAGPSPREVNAEGLISDGRETVLRDEVFKAAISLRWPDDPQPIAELAWSAFCQKCSITDGKWTFEKALQKARYIVKKRRDGQIVPRAPMPGETVGPHWQRNLKPVETIREEMLEAVADVGRDLPPRTVAVLAAPPGAGKTRAIIQLLSSSELRAEIYAPSIGLAQEIAAKLPVGQAQVIKGRSQPLFAGSDQRMCSRHEMVEQVAKAGLSVEKTICETCPLRAGCAYQAQFHNPARIKVQAHSYLVTERRASECVPDLIVIDEAFWAKALEINRAPIDAIHGLDFVRSSLVSALRTGRVLGELHRRGVTARDVREIAAEHQRRETLSHAVDGSMPDAQIATSLKRLNSHPRLGAALFRLAEEMKAVKPAVFGLGGQEQPSRSVELANRPLRETSHVVWLESDELVTSVVRKLKRLECAAPVICIDGQADPVLCEQLFLGRDVRYRRWDAARNATIFQVITSSFSKRQFEVHPELIGRIAAFGAAQAGSVALFAQKPVRCQLTGEPSSDETLPCPWPHDGLDIANFGQLVGRNDFESHDVAIIAGRQQLPPAVAESYRGLWWRDPEPLKLTGEYVYMDRTYCHPSSTVVSVQVHPDRRIQVLVEQSREWEVVQAIDRLRLLNDGKPKLVVVFTSLPLPVEVTHLVGQADLLPESPRWEIYAEQAGGVLVKRAKWIADNLPDEFAKPKDAQNYLDRETWQNDSLAIYNTYGDRVILPTRSVVTEVAFIDAKVRKDRRPEPTRAVVLSEPWQAPQLLEAAVGKKLATAAVLFDGLAFMSTNDPDYYVVRHLIRETLLARETEAGTADISQKAA